VQDTKESLQSTSSKYRTVKWFTNLTNKIITKNRNVGQCPKWWRPCRI